MAKRLAVIAILILLCGCESEEEHKAKYMAFCTSHEFSSAQCEVLYMNFRENERAEESATTAAAISGAAMGMAAGAGRR